MDGQWKRVLTYMLLVYVLIHVIWNFFYTAEFFFLLGIFQIPVAFLVIVSAGMGAGAVLFYQFMKKKREEGAAEGKAEEPPKPRPAP